MAGITDANRPARVVAAWAGLDALIDASAALTKARRVILIGFSQGALMVWDALARGKVAEVVAFAGRLAFDDTPTPSPKSRALLVGGTVDQIMPHYLSPEVAERLSATGVATKIAILLGVTHTITAEGITPRQRLSQQGRAGLPGAALPMAQWGRRAAAPPSDSTIGAKQTP